MQLGHPDEPPAAQGTSQEAPGECAITDAHPTVYENVMFSSAMAAELAALDPRQRRAAIHDGNLAILAGPGAGKTRTLVARVGYLLATTSERRGVAAITYTDAAAREVGTRLRRLGMSPGRRLASRTVHAFCLQHILLPYGQISGYPLSPDFEVLDDDGSNRLWEHAAAVAGIPLGRRGIRDELPTFTTLRRRIAVGEDVSDFTARHRTAVREYERQLHERHLLDFDEMPRIALQILRDSKPARELLVARFPHLVVDEYQDLGPVLHGVVMVLLDAGMMVSAVGDPDQTMFEFLGADPRYLRELADRDDFCAIPLTFNYRSGSALVAAGRAALGADRGYQHDPRRADPGVIEISPVEGDLEAHAERTVDMVTSLLDGGTPAEDIAVLYPAQTDLRDRIIDALTAAEIPFDSERHRRTPAGPLGDLVSACAARRLFGPLPGVDSAAGSSTSGTFGETRLTSSARMPQPVRELAATWQRLRNDTRLAGPDDTLRSLARQLLPVLDASDRERAADDAGDFVSELNEVLELRRLADDSRDQRDRLVPDVLEAAVEQGLSMAELAGGRAPGRLVLTTYHSAKGREFIAVILPGLVEGLVPFYFADQGISAAKLESERRQFYVAVTRASDAVVLIPGTYFTAWRRIRRSDWSQFVVDIQRTMDSSSQRPR